MTPSGPRRRLLIVDDEEAMRLLLAKFVQQDLGAEVTLAGTCEAALRLARAVSFDAILLDLVMPGVGGVEVLRQIRADSANRSAPVVIVSVLVKDPETGEPLTEQRAKALGAPSCASPWIAPRLWPHFERNGACLTSGSR